MAFDRQGTLPGTEPISRRYLPSLATSSLFLILTADSEAYSDQGGQGPKHGLSRG